MRNPKCAKIQDLTPLVLVLVILLTPWTKAQSQASAWKVAIVLPITGPLSPIGEKLKKGYQLALKKAEKEGQSLEVLWVDERLLNQEESRKTLAETLRDPHTVALLGAYSSHATFNLAGMAERLRVPLIIPSSMADRLTRQGYQWVFRVCPSSSQYLRGFVSYLITLFPSPPTTAILYENTPWGQELQRKLTKILGDAGPVKTLTLAYTPGANHYPKIMKETEKKRPSLVILVSSAADTLALYKNLQTLKIRCLVAGAGMGLSSPRLMEKTLPSVPGLLFPSPWVPQANWPGARNFAQRYEKAYGEPADYHSAEAYSALSILSRVLKKVGCNPEEPRCRSRIRKTLEQTPFSTPLGPVKFISNEGHTHQNRLLPLMVQIQGGKAVVVHPQKAAEGKVHLPFPKGN